MHKILVLCTGNSCRSQMAEGYLKKFAGDRAMVFSAGVEAHGLNSRAVQVMKEDNIDISGHHSKTIDQLDDKDFDLIITVCDNAKERCPVFPSNARKFHIDFEDPAKVDGPESEVMNKFREVRNQIRCYCDKFIRTEISNSQEPEDK